MGTERSFRVGASRDDRVFSEGFGGLIRVACVEASVLGARFGFFFQLEGRSSRLPAEMNCEILRTLYLRSNGEIPCNCAAGERINLGWSLGDPDWDISKVFENENYTAIRESFAADKTPWGSVCERCAFFVPKEPMDDQLAKTKRIEKFQVEPALTCALRCPGCSRADQIKRRKPPFVLSEKIFQQTLDSLVANEYDVRFFYYCGQGEPLNHPRFQDLAIMARDAYPGAKQVVNTNGNHLVSKLFDPSLYIPREFIVSIDGLDQSSYEQYRVNGNVEQALQFMKDLKSLPNPPYVEWKYILFTYNDSDDEIRRAQEKAKEIGVDRIMFVLTHSQEKSERFTVENLDELPLLPGVGYHTQTPHLAYKKEFARLLQIQGEQIQGGAALGVESVARNNAGVGMFQAELTLPEFKGPSRFSLSMNGEPWGELDLANCTELGRAFPFTLSKKGLDAQIEELQFDCRLLGEGDELKARWKYRFSFDEAELRKRTSTAV